VLGLSIRAFADALLGEQVPPAVELRTHRVDVNRASVAELSVLPGVGRARAEAIVVERIRNGPFHGLAELERVDGLGPTTTHAFRDMVVFGSPDRARAR
jgi:competence protein ComEA